MMFTPNVWQCAALVISIVLVGLIVMVGRDPGVAGMRWAYEIGDQALYRFIFLVLVLVIASYANLFPVALMLVLLYLVINSMIPMLSNMPENFVFGPPTTDCNAYNKASVQRVGTPFYPLNNEANGGNQAFDSQQVPNGDSYDIAVASN